MPLPIGVQIGIGASTAVGTSVVIGAIQAELTADMYRRQAVAWSLEPIRLPPPEGIVHAWVRGWVRDKTATDALAYHGIDVTEDTWQGQLWRRYLASAYTYPDAMVASHLWASRYISNGVWRASVMNAGGSPEHWGTVAESLLQYPSPTETLVTLNRGLVSEQQAHTLLDRQLIVSGWPRDAYLRLRHQIPPMSDIVRYVVRESFNEDLSKAFGLDTNWPNPMLVWAMKQGYGWPLGTEPGFAGPNPNLTWAQAEWRAHWQPVSPTQLYVMGQRLRPGVVPADIATPQTGPPGTYSVAAGLQRADYSPEDARRLMAISYNVPTRNDLMQMLRFGIITTQQQLIDGLLTSGFSPQEAPALAEMLFRQSGTLRLSNPIGLTRSRIEAMYRIGSITRGAAIDALISLTFTQDESQLIILSVDEAIHAEFVRLAVSGVRRRTILGEYDLREARAALSTIGVAPNRIPDYIAAWSWETHIRRDFGSLRILRRFARQGVITAGELVFRLRRVGYDDTTISAIVASIELDRRSDQARENERQLREIERQRKAVAAQAAAMRRRVTAVYTVPRMKLYYRDGTMSESEIRDILKVYYQWDAAAINRELATWPRSTGEKIGREPP